MLTTQKRSFFRRPRLPAWGAAALLGFATAAWGAPMVRCVDLRHDFGTLTDDQVVRHVYRVENHGDAPLELKVGRACCGAEIALPVGPIPPGHASGVQLEVSLRGWDGTMRKTIYVRTNDPALPILRLELVGRVVPATTSRSVR
jgi:hypothetical protein